MKKIILALALTLAATTVKADLIILQGIVWDGHHGYRGIAGKEDFDPYWIVGETVTIKFELNEEDPLATNIDLFVRNHWISDTSDLLRSHGYFNAIDDWSIYTPYTVIELKGNELYSFDDNYGGHFWANVEEIPEPATGLLYGAGLLGLCYASRKGRRNPRRYVA